MKNLTKGFVQIVVPLFLVVCPNAAFAAVSTSNAVADKPAGVQDIKSNWLEFQRSDASDSQKIQDTVKAFFTVALSDYSNQSFILPDFLLGNDPYLTRYTDGRIKYMTQNYRLWQNFIRDYNLTPSYDGIEINGDTAVAKVTPVATYHESISDDVLSYPSVQHTITLHRNDGTWIVIKDDFADQMKGALGDDPDWNKLIQDAPRKWSEYQADRANPQKPLSTTTQNTVLPQSYTVVSYNRTAAINYANAHALSYNTSQFIPISGNDCQNFVSQCVWAGFGGSSSGIASHASPMVAGSGSNAWWADTSSYNSNWAYTFSFESMLGANEANGYVGVHGISMQPTDQQSANSDMSQMVNGDVFFDTSGSGHVMFEVSGDGSWTAAHIDAHTNDHYNYSISSLYGTTVPPTFFHYEHIYNDWQPSSPV